MFKKSKFTVIFISAATSIMMFAGLASAHVTVKPTVTTPNAWENYTIKIPVERDIATTKVTLKIPNEVDFKQYQPVPDWQISTEKDTAGKISSITWTATGNGIATGQFQSFNFVAQNPKTDTSLAWDAYQYYKDGLIVEWTGDEGSESPHSVTVVSAATATEDATDTSGLHEDDHDTKTPTAPTTPTEPTEPTEPVKDDHNHSDTSEPSNNTTGLVSMIISIAALILSIAALIVALNKRKR